MKYSQDFLDITLLTDEELLEAFNKCDKDNSGTIEKSEVCCCDNGRQFPHARKLVCSFTSF